MSKKTTKIRLAFLHDAITWPGVCGAEKTLSNAKMPGLELQYDHEEQVLVLDLKGQRAMVPSTMVQIMIVDQSPAKA